jgi:hypothetical protein
MGRRSLARRARSCRSPVRDGARFQKTRRRDSEAGAVCIRAHGKGNLGAKPRGEVIADILAAIKERRA